MPVTFSQSLGPVQTTVTLNAHIMPLGAGGWIRDLGIVLSDNTMTIPTDTYGCYLFNASTPSGGNAGGNGLWGQLVSTNSIPSGDPTLGVLNRESHIGSLGVYAIAAAPSNTLVLYMMWIGFMYKSTNKGVSWTNLTSLNSGTQFAISVCNANNTGVPGTGDATYGPKMAIDPNNANFCWFGLTGNAAGIYYTQNGGTSWTGPIGSGTLPVPTTSQYSYCFVYSPGSSTILYVGINGVGIYCTANANSATPTWTKISGAGTGFTSLTSFRRAFCDSTGRLWVTADDGTTNNVYVYSGGGTGGTWTHVTAANINNGSNHAIAEDPTVASAQRIVICDALANLIESLDGGTTWVGGTGSPTGIGLFTCTDVPYLAQGNNNTLQSGYVVGNMAFDSSGNLWWASGVGMFKAPTPNHLTSSDVNWISVTAGIEQLVAVQICASPSGNAVGAHWDRGIVPVRVPQRQYSIVYYPNGLLINPGPSLDWSGSLCFVGILPYAGSGSCYTTGDGGLTFNLAASGPAGGVQGTSVCATSATNFIAMANVGNLSYTQNASANWTVSPIAVSSGTYNSSTGLVTLTLASSPAFPTTGSPGANNLINSVSGLTDTPYTISSGSYNNATGVVTLNLGSSASFANGTNMTVSVTGSGTNLAQLNGVFACASGTGTSAVTFAAAPALNTGGGVIAISIAGGTVDVVANLDAGQTVATVSGSTLTYTGQTGLGTVVITGGSVSGGTWIDLGSYFLTNFSIPKGTMNVGASSTGAADVVLAADRVNATTAYALINKAAASGGGVYRTTNGGAAWNLQSAVDAAGGLTSTVLGLNGRQIFRSIYGLASGLLYCNSTPNQGVHPYTAGSNFQISFDGGVHWADVSANVRDVWGFDTTLTIGSFPRIWIWGWVNIASVWTPGCYYSDNQGSTWTFAVKQEMWGTLDILNWLEASKVTANEFYTSYEGSGHARYGAA